MELSDQYRKLLVKEINFVLKSMNENKDALEILYYFSGITGMIHRILNIEFHPELVHAHFVLQSTQETLRQTIMSARRGEIATPRVTDEHIEKLIEFTKALANRIRQKKSIDNVLKKFILLTYSISGNGYYLVKKGLFKV